MKKNQYKSPNEPTETKNLNRILDDSLYLRSAFEAQELLGQEAVCGTDERIIINPLNTYYEAICFLGIDAIDGTTWRGTGFYINYGGQASILTAGHCIYISQHGGFAEKIHVIRGREGNQMPLGITTVNASNLRVPDEWKRDNNHEHDWGLILMGGNPWGFNCSALSDNDLINKEIRTAGYPADKPEFKMWSDHGPIKRTTTQKIYYMQDTYGGDSGGPIITTSSWNAIGIHTYGRCPNSATRLTQNHLNQIKTWTNE
jgi:glutamyl endopeptidase